LQPLSFASVPLRYIEANRPLFLSDVPVQDVNADYPCTLDLRQFWKKE